MSYKSLLSFLYTVAFVQAHFASRELREFC
jgi:hypothetical protein